MDDRIFLSLISSVTMIITLIGQMISLNASKKDIFLGIRIPESERNNDELRILGKRYMYTSLMVGIPTIVIFSVLIYQLAYLWLFMVFIFAFVFIDFLIYYRYNRKVSKLKAKQGWLKTKKQVVTIDTDFSRENFNKIMPSAWWFSMSLIIIAVCVTINIIYYPKLPYKFPTHWGVDGKPNGYSIKSYSSILSMPLIQSFMVAIMFFVYKIISWSKREINSNGPEESKIRNLKFRRIWAIYIIVINYIMLFIFIIVDLQTMQIIKPDSRMILPLVIIMSFGITAVSIIISIKVGQGGSKLKVGSENKVNDVDVRDDDRFWKLGNTIYYNKDDPSVFVEKRVGIGWTVNAATTWGIVFYVVIIIIFIFSFVPLFFIKK